MAKKMTASVPAYEGAPDVPNFGGVGYVAVTENEVALVKTKTGLIKMKITDHPLNAFYQGRRQVAPGQSPAAVARQSPPP
jgi:hypothetical protein